MYSYTSVKSLRGNRIMYLCFCYVLSMLPTRFATGDGRLGRAQLLSFWPGVDVRGQPPPYFYSAIWRAFCLLSVYRYLCTTWRYVNGSGREGRRACLCILLFSCGPGAACGDPLSFPTILLCRRADLPVISMHQYTM